MRIAARRLLIGRLLVTRENEKHRKYDRIVADIDDDEDKEFRPLVLSAGGTLSRTTKLLVDTLSRTQITRDLMDPNQAGKADPAYGHAASTLRNFAFQLLTKQILFRQADFFKQWRGAPPPSRLVFLFLSLSPPPPLSTHAPTTHVYFV